LLANFITLVTLSTLSTFAKAGAKDITYKDSEFILFNIISKTAAQTTKKSNLFHPLLK
jgi:hypothetical protein